MTLFYRGNIDPPLVISFDPDAASLFFSLASSRYERNSGIVSSSKSFSAWGEIFGDAVAVAAMVDRLVHHAEVTLVKDDSYRLRREKEVIAADQILDTLAASCRRISDSGH